MKLTYERRDGGYDTNRRKDELVQRLGAIEHDGDRLLECICDDVCRHRELDQEELDDKCAGCPVAILAKVMGLD